MEQEPNRLGTCPECGQIINLTNIEEIPNGAVIGCGLAEDDFMKCENCLCTYDDGECKYIRADNALSLTTAREV